MNKKGVWIKGSFFNAKNYFDKDGACQKIIKSSIYKATDNISQGYKPKTDGNGVLYSWLNKPLAYYDIPTLNNMIFTKQLWQAIRDNPFIKASLENKCFWGEEQHRDSSEVITSNIAIRINDFRVADNNLVLGDIDLMDTPNGLIVYALAKTGAIGNSSRGFGDLIDIGNGLSKVDEETYLAVDWDVVTFPAVPNCLSMYTDATDRDLTESVLDLEKGLREQVTDSIVTALEKDNHNTNLQKMFENLELKSKKKSYLVASKVFKNTKIFR